MSEPSIPLGHPPIVEAVIDIECDLPPTLDLGALEQPAVEQFRDRYPDLQKQFVHQYEVRAKGGPPPDFSSRARRPRIAALQFLQGDKKQLVQVRAHGFSFNRLAPYTTFDDYAPEIERRWQQYCSIAKPVQVTVIKLRYINRILLPTDNGRVDLQDYFEISPRLPGEDVFTLTGFVQQYSAIEKNTGHQINIVLTPQRLEGEQLPVILDSGVSAEVKGDPKEWAPIAATIQSLRELKNRVFRRSLTEKCLMLFQ